MIRNIRDYMENIAVGEIVTRINNFVTTSMIKKCKNYKKNP